MTAVVDTDPAPVPGVRAGAFGNATHLVCRECGAHHGARPLLRLYRVLRSARGRL